MKFVIREGMKIWFNDQFEFDVLWEEVFTNAIYDWKFETDSPCIIDAGANIGLATLYWTRKYQNAKIVCIEPSPVQATLLRKNLIKNQIEARVIQKALTKTGEEVDFFEDQSWGVFSSILKGGFLGDRSSVVRKVESIKLSSLLNSKVDLLKLDIEGAETEVIIEAEANLGNVGGIVMEFHKFPSHDERDMVQLLRNKFKFVMITEDPRKEKDPQRKLFTIVARNTKV